MNNTGGTAAVLLQARGLQLRFGGVVAARDVDIDVFAGEFLAIIGQNGAGKSSFLNICTGYLKPQAGSVTFAGRSVLGRSPQAIARAGIARAFQHPQLLDRHTVRDTLRYAVASRGRFWCPWRPLSAPPYADEARRLLQLFGLETVAGQQARDIAEGTRKLLDIAMALALRPQLLLMDEP